MALNKKTFYSNHDYLIKNNKFLDILFLLINVVLLQGYFIKNIGFYSDDWAFLSILSSSNDQSILGLVSNFFAKDDVVRMRPVQVFELSILYWLFGTNPFGYHLFNTLVFSSIVVFFYLVLKKYNLPGLITIAIPLIYVLLPHYSTARIWMATFCTNVSIAFFFINFYANLTYIRINKANSVSWTWLSISLISLVTSILAYEVILPLFFINFLLTWIESKKQSNLIDRSSRRTILLLLNLFLFILCTLFKVIISVRTGGFGNDYISQVVEIIKLAIGNDFITYGVKLPQVVWRIFQLYKNYHLFLMASFVSLFIFFYFLKIKISNYKLTDWLYTIVAGLIIYLGGYAIFLTTVQIQITPTGLSNRVTMAASLGVAICYFGFIGFLSNFIKIYWLKSLLFSLTIATLCSCNYIINCTIASFYIKSYSIQQVVLSNIYSHVPRFTPGSILLLDGICPYSGPAPIFECYWDIGGALQTHYRIKELSADVRTSKLIYNEKGITTTIYGEKKFYPYSRKLIIYNNQSKKYYFLTSLNAAKLYFTTSRCAELDNCPTGAEGYGASIF